MPNVVIELLPYALLGTGILAAILFVVALWYFRRSRRDPYWVLRRNASRIGWRVFLTSLTLFGLVGVVWVGTSILARFTGDNLVMMDATETVVATATTASVPPSFTPTLFLDDGGGDRLTGDPPDPTATIELTASSTATPTEVIPTATATQQLTRTPRPQPTPTLTAVPTQFSVVPRESNIVPGNDAELMFLGIGGSVDENLQLAEQSASLAAGLPRIFFAVGYSGMQDGAAWERALFRDDTFLQGGAYLWTAGETGEMVNFFGDSEGFAAGEYEIRLYLAGKPVAVQGFTIVE